MAFYEEMAAMVRDLTKPDTAGGLGQGSLSLSRTTPGTVDPLKPWEIPNQTISTEILKGAVRGVDRRLVGTTAGSTVLLASDRVAITEVPVNGYTAGDVFSVDGTPVMIIDVEKIPAAGTPAAYRFTIRG